MNNSTLEQLIAENPAVMLYFYNDACAPCKVLRPKVEQLVTGEFPKMKFILINTAEAPETAAQNNVFSAPTILCFFEGREYLRESKNISISELHQKIERLYHMIYP